ncbi:MAG: hypothetical protein ABI142_03190, partial [Bryocella sp.]
RSQRAAEWFARLARWLRWNPMLAHDGPVSFRRALSVEEWRAVLAESGVDAELRDAGWGRICVVVVKKRGA